MRTTKDIVSKFAELLEDQRQAVVADALYATAGMKWLPLPGPQTQAYFSQADILLYGGAAGGSKSDCGLDRAHGTWSTWYGHARAAANASDIE